MERVPTQIGMQLKARLIKPPPINTPNLDAEVMTKMQYYSHKEKKTTQSNPDHNKK